MSPSKQVRFDENADLPSAVHRRNNYPNKSAPKDNSIKFGVREDKIDGYSKNGQPIGLKLKKLEQEIEQQNGSGKMEERDTLLS